jgi:hypothetical protein
VKLPKQRLQYQDTNSAQGAAPPGGFTVQTHVQEQIQANPKWAAQVEQATKLLEAEVGISADVVTADWSIAQDSRKRSLIGLKVSDPLATVEARFTLEEMANPSHLERRLGFLGRNLLEARFHQQQRLKQRAQNLEGD